MPKKLISSQLPNQSTIFVYRTILSSPAVWTLIAQNFSTNWTLYVLLSWLPQYFKEKWGVDVSSDVFATGYLNATPFLCNTLVSILGGRVADMMIERKWPKFFVRRLFQSAGLIASSLFLLLLSFFGNDLTTSFLYLTLAVSFMGLETSGVPVVFVCLC